MNPERPHEIELLNRLQSLDKTQPKSYVREWLPLTDEEAAKLIPMNEDQRAEWFSNLSITEKLRRWSKAE